MGFHETVAADENTRFEGFAAELKAKQRKPARALHAKQHLGVSARVDVKGGGEGMFAAAKSYSAYVRFSNGAGANRSDKTPDARGFAVKIVGVEGKKIIPGLEEKKTQDFLFVAAPALPFKDPNEFMSFIRAAGGSPALLVPRLFMQIGLGRGIAVVKALANGPKVTSFATHPFYTAAPVTWGASAAKLQLVPASSSPSPPASEEPNAFRADLVKRLKAGELVWSVRAQKFVDDATTPIEDASVTWPESRTPYVEVATLTIAQQDVESPEGKSLSERVETMSFDPWHAIEGHRPLGAIMRARAVAYRESVLARGASPEPET